MNLQHRLNQLFVYVTFTGILFFISSCSSDDSETIEPDPFWTEARLNDFPLTEVEYLDIDIVHPTITNNSETAHGKIEITIPFSQASLNLSLKEFNLDINKYNISPTVGESQDFSNDFVTYTITSTTSATKAVHYDVTVKHGGDPFFTNNKITGFKFEKSNNPQLAATIEAVKIAEYENYTENAIYVIVPEGTNFTQLVPTITFDAAKLYYNTDIQYIQYAAGLSVNFRYPIRFYLQAENSLGNRSRPYVVIVDVANPIKFDSPLITADVKSGDGVSAEDFFAIAKWTNQGNHPITGMSPTDYIDKTYPVPDYPGNANVITASLVNPNGGTPGVLPGEQGEINVRVKRSPVTGAFTTKAVFTPTFSFDTRRISFWPADDRIENIFTQPPLAIEAKIVE
jgi:hypothetical protein